MNEIDKKSEFTSAEATNVRNSPRCIPVNTLAVVTLAFP
jgi:hypothetical protein